MRGILIAALVLVGFGASARAANLANQRQINELAARFIDAQEALSGLTGLQRPGEETAHYQTRIRAYLRALDQGVRDSADLRTSAHGDPTWKKIAEDSVRFRDEVAKCHMAWEKQPGSRILGQSLAKALSTLQAILNGLRDARP